jgi:MFS family permease
MKKVFVASIVGTVIEWYDFFLYAVVAGLVINKAFFPNASPLVATIASLSTFAIGFLARPVGAVIFGHLGDKLGRKRILSITLVVMGIATFGTGILPTYAEIGILAPIILVLMRILQGIGVGGEYGGAILMLFEHGYRARRRGLLGALPSASAAAGWLLASGTMALITAATTTEQFQAWGWRIPFVASVLLLAFGFWIRRSVDESPVFAAAQQAERTVRAPLLELFRQYPRQVLVATALPICTAVSANIALVYVITYATARGVPSGNLLTVNTVAQAVYLPLILGWALVSDRVGRLRPMAFGMLGAAAWAFAFWPLVDTGSWGFVLLAVIGALFFVAAMYGPQAAFLAELFPVQVRYSGISFGYQVAFAVAGGTTPVIAVALQAGFGTWVPVAAMTVVAALLSLAAVVAGRGIVAAPHEDAALTEQKPLAAVPERDEAVDAR